MPEFSYKARDTAGKSVLGQLTANDAGEAMQQLSARQLIPVQIQPVVKQTIPLLNFQQKVSSSQLVAFYSQLADLMTSGVPLLRSLRLIEDQASSPVLKSVVADIRDQVADGRRLAQAMARHPATFSNLVISLVEAGEEGSFLEDALKRLALFVQHQNELKGKVLGAMIYPLFVASFGSIIVGVMLVFFVPKFQPIFDRMAAERGLPWTTSTLMSLSDTLQAYWPLLLIGGALLLLAGSRAAKSERGRRLIDGVVIREWRLGPLKIGLSGIFRNLAISRFCRVLGTLLQNGVPMLRSITIARKASGNVILEEAIERSAEFVSSGKSLSGPLRQSGQFPADVVEMIAVAEEANQLERVLVEVSDQLERKVQSRLETLVHLMEPVMLLGLAAFVLFIVAALLLPILQSSSLV
ncbi:MAG: type II secretion system F family protein [Planctomycetaceae bacterium]|nr:type II secretion system F family protein [Planctomycetaceae bacterium]